MGVELVGYPRLVRLNPNIPFKTRGNAALAARFGHGRGAPQPIGQIGDHPVPAYPAGRPLEAGVARAVFHRAWEVVLSHARIGEARTDPALVASRRHLPARLYWHAVRDFVPLDQAVGFLQQSGAEWRTVCGEGGLVGASAAIAWPGRHATFEMIAYREPERVGTRRQVDRVSVERAAQRHPELFLCSDPRTRRLLVAPHTDCPILYGLRSTDPVPLAGIVREVDSEPVDRWLVFQTNQGTGDHLARRRVAELRPYSSGRISGTVTSAAVPGRGGHVRFSVVDAQGGSLDCMAFEPTKTLPRVSRSLVAGDQVRVWGGRAADAVFRVEAIELLRLRPRFRAARAPTCPTCRRATRSRGTSRGFRCDRCRVRFPPESARGRPTAPEYGPGVYHPTPSARRHLHPRGPEPGRLDTTIL